MAVPGSQQLRVAVLVRTTNSCGVTCVLQCMYVLSIGEAVS